jgi:purine-binding chemotaxis protein CheW
MSTAIEQQQSKAEAEGQGEQCLTFLLDGEEYGVDILRVQEIKGWEKVTPLPNTCDYIQGVINLRGFVIPIVNLRRRFGRPDVERSATTVVIVLKVRSGAGERTMGFIADAVSDVYAVNASQLRPPPDFGQSAQIQFVKALATVDNKMVILLDVDQLVDNNIQLNAA